MSIYREADEAYKSKYQQAMIAPYRAGWTSGWVEGHLAGQQTERARVRELEEALNDLIQSMHPHECYNVETCHACSAIEVLTRDKRTPRATDEATLKIGKALLDHTTIPEATSGEDGEWCGHGECIKYQATFHAGIQPQLYRDEWVEPKQRRWVWSVKVEGTCPECGLKVKGHSKWEDNK